MSAPLPASPLPTSGPIAPIAVVLPPGEGFGPEETGAVGTVAHRLASVDPARTTVIGAVPRAPVFEDVRFVGVRPGLAARVAGARRAYVAAVGDAVARLAPALIEVHNRPDLATALWRRFPATPIVLFLHNDPQEMHGLRRAGPRAILMSRMAAIVTVSAYLRYRLLDDTAPARDPIVLPNGIDLASLPPRLPHGERERTILFAGRVVADKGADRFVEACALALPHLPGWRAEMIGADGFSRMSRETPFLRALRPAAAAAGVTMHGYRPRAAVLEALSRAAIAVVPSRWGEPFGLAALEAMACGAALVCSPRGGLPEVAGDAALYADPDNADSIAGAIVDLAQDPALRARHAESGLARATLFDTLPTSDRLAAIRVRSCAAHGRG